MVMDSQLLIDGVAAFVLIGLAGAIVAIYWRSLRIPDPLNIALLGAGLVYWLMIEPDIMFQQIFFAALVGAGFWGVRETYFRLKRQPGLGLGDVKLAAAAAVWISPLSFPLFLLTASVAGLVSALVLYRGDGANFQTAVVPFGPFLSISLVLTWFSDRFF